MVRLWLNFVLGTCVAVLVHNHWEPVAIGLAVFLVLNGIDRILYRLEKLKA
jgi:hypothetical protein